MVHKMYNTSALWPFSSMYGLNRHHTTIKFTANWSAKDVTFLDTLPGKWPYPSMHGLRDVLCVPQNVLCVHSFTMRTRFLYTSERMLCLQSRW